MNIYFFYTWLKYQNRIFDEYNKRVLVGLRFLQSLSILKIEIFVKSRKSCREYKKRGSKGFRRKNGDCQILIRRWRISPNVYLPWKEDYVHFLTAV